MCTERWIPAPPNDDWAVDSQNNSIADYWANIGAGSSATALANAEINIGFLATNLSGTSSKGSTTPPAVLSTAAKSGIITGAIIAGLVLIGFVALMVVRKRRNTTVATRPTPAVRAIGDEARDPNNPAGPVAHT